MSKYIISVGPEEIGGLMAVLEKDNLKDMPEFKNIYKQLKDKVEIMMGIDKREKEK